MSICVSLFLSCSDERENLKPDHGGQPSPPAENRSEKGKITFTGSVQLEEGPQDLLIHSTSLFAVRDHRIFRFQLSNPAKPVLQGEYSLGSGAARFGKLYHTGTHLYVPCQTDGKLYELDNDLVLVKAHDLGIASFKPNVALQDSEGNFWVGGSNGSRGILAKYRHTNNALTLSAHWIAPGNDSNIESVVEKDGHLIVSIPKGDLYAFSKADVATGPVDAVTYQHEAGHEKWGHTVIRHGNKVFWANWGAGLATVDISDPTDMIVGAVITNSNFKSQFANAEGTNVYDVAYNAQHDFLCIANGWSGVLLVKPGKPTEVVDFIDPEYFQNRCIETMGDYIYTGNISGGMSGDLKGIKVFKINK